MPEILPVRRKPCLAVPVDASLRAMRGFFGVGVEGISKPMNVGSLYRTAHAFGADFIFAIAPAVNMRLVRKADTSDTDKHVPFYEHASVDALTLPRGCQLVGVELLEEATDLPSFTHPERAAYVFGSERGSLSPALLARCGHVVKIPTRFCVNLGVAAAILMYDRMLTRQRFAPRPVAAGGPVETLPPHVHGGRFTRRGR
jgi:tRNA G18 (ribose-2'-O)-methylase SpoU